MEITNTEKEIFYRCQGNCRICFNEGSCNLENEIKKQGLEQIKKKIYNE